MSTVELVVPGGATVSVRLEAQMVIAVPALFLFSLSLSLSLGVLM